MNRREMLHSLAGVLAVCTSARMLGAAPVMGDPLWYQVLQELMCHLYKAFGGDCADLEWEDPEDEVICFPTVRAAFLANGIPTDPEELQELESILAELDSHYLSPSVTIPASSVSAGQALNAEIWGEIE